MTATKLADLQKAGQHHVEAAKAILEKNSDKDPSDWAEDDRRAYDEALAKGREKLEEIRTAKADLAVLDGAKQLGAEIGDPAVKDLDAQGNQPVRERVKALGLQVVESPEFKAMMAPFKDGKVNEKLHIQSDPIDVKGLFVGGSDTSAGTFVVNEQTGIVEMLGRKELKIRDLVSVRRTGSDTVEYVQQTNHTNAAAVVPEATSSAAPTMPALDGNALGAGAALVNNAGGGYKPEGAWAFERKTAVVKTIAEWVPATKRALADVAALEGLINDELRADIAETEEAQILNGDGSGENFTGINNWSGIQTQSFSSDLFQSIRKGITKARTIGRVNPNAVVVSPVTAELIDLAQDGELRYRYGGPQAIGPHTVWGLPVVESETQPDGYALVGDFSKAVLWDREQTTVTMTDSHADFFIRNLVAILAEERLAFAVTRPKAFVNVDIAA
nr:phage major capsid protein [Mycolicibacterium sp. F2034L]